jgi:hypothetical protein
MPPTSFSFKKVRFENKKNMSDFYKRVYANTLEVAGKLFRDVVLWCMEWHHGISSKGILSTGILCRDIIYTGIFVYSFVYRHFLRSFFL